MMGAEATMQEKTIPGTVGKYSPSGHILTVTGPAKRLQRMKDRLTLTNKSIEWQLKRTVKTRSELANRLPQLKGQWEDAAKIKLVEYDKQITELQSDLVVEYWEETNDGLQIPPGFWFLCESIEGDRHLNTAVPAVLLPGLRPYQQDDVREMLRHKRATAKIATGLGKSWVIASLCATMSAAKIRTVVIVPSEYLVGQLYDTLKSVNLSVTAAGGGRIPVPGCDVLVTTVQSAGSYMDLYGCVLVDESHHTPATTWMECMTRGINVEYVYNLTATPFRTDGLDLAIHAFGGPTTVDRDARWGIVNGWLVQPDIYIVKVAPRAPNGDPVYVPEKVIAAKAYQRLIHTLETFETIYQAISKASAKNRKTILLFKTVKAGKAFSKYIEQKYQIKIPVASAKSKGVIVKFRNNELNVLIGNDRLLGEGVDIPNADVLIIATQHSSKALSYQAVGRVLRPAAGKTGALVIDIAVSGYLQFNRAVDNRAGVYANIAGVAPKQVG